MSMVLSGQSPIMESSSSNPPRGARRASTDSPVVSSRIPTMPFATISAGDAQHTAGADGGIVDSSADTWFDSPSLNRDISMRGIHPDVDAIPYGVPVRGGVANPSEHEPRPSTPNREPMPPPSTATTSPGVSSPRPGEHRTRAPPRAAAPRSPSTPPGSAL